MISPARSVLPVVLACLVFAGVPSRAQETTIRVDVRLVNVLTTIRDAQGHLVPTLEPGDFQILDEGRPQAIRVFERQSGIPLSIALLLDASLSTGKDLKFEQESANRFIRAILRPQDRISLFRFTHNVTQLAPFTNDAGRLERALRSIRPEGGTSLFDAVYLACDELRRREGRRVLILITDGGDTTSVTDFKGALRAAQEADAVIYSVIVVPIRSESGRDIGGEHALQLLADGTGGRFFTPDTPAELDPVFAAIGNELRTQYVLGFYAPAEEATGYRRLEVKINRPGFTVQARKGYYLRGH